MKSAAPNGPRPRSFRNKAIAGDGEADRQVRRVPVVGNLAAQLALDRGARENGAEALHVGLLVDARPAVLGPGDDEPPLLLGADDIDRAVRG